MTDAEEDHSISDTPGESYGGLLESVGPAVSELSLVALVSTMVSGPLRAVAGFLSRRQRRRFYWRRTGEADVGNADDRHARCGPLRGSERSAQNTLA
jgi:hypothetical protein